MAPTHNSGSHRQSKANSEKLPRLPESVTLQSYYKDCVGVELIDLFADARIQKRPLIRQQIASPYAGKGSEKVVYISSKTSFMAAIKRVQHLLNQIRKRTLQADLSRKKKSHSNESFRNMTSAKATDVEPVIITATGKAIDKALRMALFLQCHSDTGVKLVTTSADAIDDIVPHESSKSGNNVPAIGFDDDMSMGGMLEKPPGCQDALGSEEFLPSTRIRHASVIQIFVTAR